MAAGFTYYHRHAHRVVKSHDIGAVFTGWQPGKECWLFVAPHDDDVITGAGLTFLTGLAEGAEVHAVVVTDGSMGYCSDSQRHTIAQVRAQETQQSFQLLGLPPERLHRLKFPDCNLNTYRGRHFTTADDPTELAGASGLQNSFPYLLRKIRPTRLFLPTSADLHPDHRIVHDEMLISLFHAQGTIWPELGPPMAAIPQIYEYATYCDFPEPPQIRLAPPPELLETKLRGIRAYASQEQIELLIEVQRNIGPEEYLRELNFHFYAPEKYRALFGEGA